MHYRIQYSKLASATEDFDFFSVMWLVLSLPPFVKLINSEEVVLSRVSALCCASLRQIPHCETTGRF